jgi:hypothetical protein
MLHGYGVCFLCGTNIIFKYFSENSWTKHVVRMITFAPKQLCLTLLSWCPGRDTLPKDPNFEMTPYLILSHEESRQIFRKSRWFGRN